MMLQSLRVETDRKADTKTDTKIETKTETTTTASHKSHSSHVITANGIDWLQTKSVFNINPTQPTEKVN